MSAKIQTGKSTIQCEQGKSDIDLTKTFIISSKWKKEFSSIINVGELKNRYRVTYMNEQTWL